MDVHTHTRLQVQTKRKSHAVASRADMDAANGLAVLEKVYVKPLAVVGLLANRE